MHGFLERSFFDRPFFPSQLCCRVISELTSTEAGEQVCATGLNCECNVSSRFMLILVLSYM